MVIAAASGDRVTSRAIRNGVVSGAALKRIVAMPARQIIVGVIADQKVVAVA